MATNYYLINDNESLMVKKDHIYTNSFEDLLHVDKFTLTEGNNLLDNLKEWNVNRVIDYRKKFYVVRTPFQVKSNVYPALIHTHPSKVSSDIVEHYLNLINYKIDGSIGFGTTTASEEHFKRVFIGALTEAIKNMPDEAKEELFSSDSLLDIQIADSYRNRPWEFYNNIQSFVDIRNLLAMYLGVRRKCFASDNEPIIPTSKELNDMKLKSTYDNIQGLEPKNLYEVPLLSFNNSGELNKKTIVVDEDDGEQLTLDSLFNTKNITR